MSSETGQAYSLKLKRGAVNRPALLIPRYLMHQGIVQVIVPLRSSTNELWHDVDAFALILYLFIDGHVGAESGLSESQWAEFGAVVGQIHACQLPAKLLSALRKETFMPKWIDIVRQLQRHVPEASASF